MAVWKSDLEAWRKRVDEGLRRDRGWLSIIGRWELEDGRTKIGSAPGNDVKLPAALAPATLGTVEVANGKARLTLAAGQKMRPVVNGKPGDEAASHTFFADGTGNLEWLTAGRLSLQMVRREDGRFVMRASDRDAPILKSFPPRHWYEARPDYVVPARFLPQPKGTKFPIANVRGEISYEEVAGQIEFQLDGQTIRLDALDDEGNLFIIFRDQTSAKTTYPPGRFLYIRKPDDGVWKVDFNRAYNPPCSFSAYTTCPLPPPQNWLKVAVPAGERYTERRS